MGLRNSGIPTSIPSMAHYVMAAILENIQNLPATRMKF